jgi:hypothetical protein
MKLDDWLKSHPNSTRAQILAKLKNSIAKRPPDEMSDEEMQELLKSGQGRAGPADLAGDEEYLLLDRLRPDVNSPSVVNIGLSGKSRNFWFGLVIGCSGPDSTSRTVLSSRGLQSRNAAKLAYAIADVQTLRDFAKQPFTDPERVFPKGFRAFAGTFAEGAFLSEATSADLDRALSDMRSFFERNEDDPEWMGGQVNIFFAGHGADNKGESVTNRGGLFLKDTVVTPKDLQDKLMSTLPKSVLEEWKGPTTYGNCRVDMYLDCCYSAQFVAAFIGRLFNNRKGLVPGKFWCSSMPFQQSFESDRFQHGVFTSYLMSDYTTKRQRGFLAALFQSRSPSLRKGDVGKHTDNQQNPLLIDFSSDLNMKITIPGAVETRVTQKDVPMRDDQNGDHLALWLNDYLQVIYNKNCQPSR